jgi:hypothetical protein
MSEEENKLLVRRYLEEVVNTGDVTRLAEFIGPEGRCAAAPARQGTKALGMACPYGMEDHRQASPLRRGASGLDAATRKAWIHYRRDDSAGGQASCSDVF